QYPVKQGWLIVIKLTINGGRNKIIAYHHFKCYYCTGSLVNAQENIDRPKVDEQCQHQEDDPGCINYDGIFLNKFNHFMFRVISYNKI
ncbi:MAG: hypothetical protein B6242_16650, partial [Anaerolineaceae bacterium 4572_78]